MIVMMSGMVIAAIVVMMRLPEGVSVPDAVRVAGALDRMNVVSFDLDFDSRYNFWSGIAGGFFLALSYFGTDQSQVQRYLSGRSVTESRLGLLFNGMFKVPMQFLILFIGVMVFVFYLFTRPPLFFNGPALERAAATEHAPALRDLETRYDADFEAQRAAATDYVAALGSEREASARESLRAAAATADATRDEARELVARAVPDAEKRDGDYIFLSFVLSYIPHGLMGLLIAVIMCAAMSSVASELAALGSTTTIDLYRRLRSRTSTPPDSARDLRTTKAFTILWGLIAIGFASSASLFDNLIEAVNIIGSIFYGTILGLFVVAMFLRHVTATPVLIGAIVAEASVVTLFFTSDLGFLWYNVIGCGLVVAVSLVLQLFRGGGAR
jgi:Na+/proline symporter